MARAGPFDDRALRLARFSAQRLDARRRSRPLELVRHLLGVQAQLPSAPGLALRPRGEAITAELVDRARLSTRSVVRTWAMRGTLHLIATEDIGWVVPLLTQPGIATARRRLRDVGVLGDQPERAVRSIVRMLGSEGPLTRAEIAEGLTRQGFRTEGQAIAYLVWLAAADGRICFGPDLDRKPTFVLTRDWVGAQPALDRERALGELASRYLRAHAPATPADLTAWSGIRRIESLDAWRAIADRIVEVPTVTGTMWSLRGTPGSVEVAAVRLLPAFDPYLLGWKDRGPILDPLHRRRVNAGGGWVRPVFLVDGRVAGTWTFERGTRADRIRVSPFARIASGVSRGIAAEARAIGSYLGKPVDVDLG